MGVDWRKAQTGSVDMVAMQVTNVELLSTVDEAYELIAQEAEAKPELIEAPVVIMAGADAITVNRLDAIFVRTFNVLRRKADSRDDVEAIASWVRACHGIPAQEQYLMRLRQDWLALGERKQCGRCKGSGKYVEAGIDHGTCYRCKGTGVDRPTSTYPARFAN